MTEMSFQISKTNISCLTNFIPNQAVDTRCISAYKVLEGYCESLELLFQADDDKRSDMLLTGVCSKVAYINNHYE